MRKNNLIQLLESFSKIELNRFEDFISSPYFNKDSRLIQLFTLLKKQVLHKKLFNEAIKTTIYQSLFKDINPLIGVITANQQKLLSARMSLLNKLAKRFLVIEALEDNPSCIIKLLNKKMLDKKQYDSLEQSNRNYLNALNKNNYKDLEYYTQAVQVQEGIMNYHSKKDLFSKEDNFQEMNHYLDLYFIIWKLRLYITMKSVVLNNDKKKYAFDTFDVINTFVNTSNYAKHPLIILYLTTIELIHTNEEEIYQRLMEQLEQYEDSISKTDLIGFYTVASNFCSQQSRKYDQLKYIQETLLLYKVMEKKQLLVEGKVLQIHKLVNLVDLSCKAGDFEWAFTIVYKYHFSVLKEKQKCTKHFLLGIIYFYQKKYHEVLTQLKEVKSLGMPYALPCRILYLKSAYELDERYSIYTMQVFKSAQSFCGNQKTISQERKKSNKNFIHILINLYKVKHNEGRVTLKKIKDKMNKMKVISNRNWLLEKLELLNCNRQD